MTWASEPESSTGPTPANTPSDSLPARQPGEEQDDLVRRIETLEHHASRQEQALKRMMTLLEANTMGRT